MFARIVDCRLKPEKKDETLRMINTELLPLLRQASGFVDVLGMSGTDQSDHVISLALWNSRDDADRFYSTPQYTKILTEIKTRLDSITVNTFTVEYSSIHKIAAGKAA